MCRCIEEKDNIVNSKTEQKTVHTMSDFLSQLNIFNKENYKFSSSEKSEDDTSDFETGQQDRKSVV